MGRSCAEVTQVVHFFYCADSCARIFKKTRAISGPYLLLYQGVIEHNP